MKATRTNLSINIQFDNVKEAEKALHKILDELSEKENFGSGELGRVSYNFAMEKFTYEIIKSGVMVKTYKSKM